MRKNSVVPWIAFRYFLSRDIPRIVHLLTWLSIASLVVGTAVLFFVLSVFNGFEALISDLFKSGDPPLKVVKREGKYFSSDSLIPKLTQMEGVLAISRMVEERGVLEHGGYRYPVHVIAVDSAYFQVVSLDSSLIAGNRNYFFQRGTILGAGVALATKTRILDPDSPVLLYMIDATSNLLLNPEESIRQTYLIPNGVVSIQKQIDDQVIWIPLSELYGLLRKRQGQVTALGIRAKAGTNLQKLKTHIQERIGPKYAVLDIHDQHMDFYKILQTEKLVSYLIVFFLLVLISFNFLGGLLMIGLLKQRGLAILSILGLEERIVKNILYFLSAYSGTVSLLAGLGLGGLFIWIQKTYGLLKFQTSEFLVIDHFPVAFQWEDVITITLSLLLLFVLIAWIATTKLFPLHFPALIRFQK